MLFQNIQGNKAGHQSNEIHPPQGYLLHRCHMFQQLQILTYFLQIKDRMTIFTVEQEHPRCATRLKFVVLKQVGTIHTMISYSIP
jgi:hypothetical protein